MNSRGVIALIASIAIGFVWQNPALAQNQIPSTMPTDNQRVSVSDQELGLRQNMRKLWTDHVLWTRDYIVASIAGANDEATAAASRLMQNQEDIGNAIAVYYGKDAGDKLTTMLKEHIQIAVDLINAAKANDQTKLNDANDRWQKNADGIADFLSSANPNWNQSDMREMMRQHLATTANEVTARLNKNFDEDIRAYDRVYDHILTMADMLSSGIVKQFPDKFK